LNTLPKPLSAYRRNVSMKFRKVGVPPGGGV
jgi:hypothetical protein